MLEILGWKKTEWDFVGKRRIAFIFSAGLCLLGIFAAVQIARGVAAVGIEFSGGVSMNVALKERIPVDNIRKAFAKRSLGGADIMEIKSEQGQRLLIRLGDPGQEKTAEDILWELAGGKGGEHASVTGAQTA